MKKLNKTLSVILLASGTSLAYAEVSVNATLTSDYVFRGISQSDSGFAVQGGADYAHESGVFVGTWASTVDYSQYGDDTNMELDFYFGYNGETENFSFDVMYNMYNYLGEDYSEDGNYSELMANAYLGAMTASFGYANDYFGTGESVTFIGGAYDIDLPDEFKLTLNLGYSMGEDALGDNILDYGATVAKSFNGFDVSAAFVGTDLDGSDSDPRFFVSVSRTF
ncbi:MAG: hypothetical protein HWE10_06795 [Gammaproteobacteria bacterium]|nr:hypothetical protein [Gammaproteobacteria bacterium]